MRRLLDSTAARIAAIALALVGVAVVAYELLAAPDEKTATAYFPLAVHLYPGSEVDVLGVKVGTVDAVTPVGDRVRVTISYDAGRKIPADVRAVVDEPTLVADRVIELTPPYAGGQVLADGAVIPLQRTRVPLELDQLTKNLVDLAAALGPQGANHDGALSRALTVGARNLRGEGSAAHLAVTRLGRLMGTLSDNRSALFASVRHLESFTATLVAHDRQTRHFATDLATVSQQLAAEDDAFDTALHDLGGALDDVAGFIRTNRRELAGSVRGLGTLTHVLAHERTLLAHIVDMGAVGISNYPHMYTPSARTYNARFDNVFTDNPSLFLCQLYGSVGGSPQQCLDYLKPLKHVPVGAR